MAEDGEGEENLGPYLIIVADAADAVSVNFSGRCKFLGPRGPLVEPSISPSTRANFS